MRLDFIENDGVYEQPEQENFKFEVDAEKDAIKQSEANIDYTNPDEVKRQMKERDEAAMRNKRLTNMFSR